MWICDVPLAELLCGWKPLSMLGCATGIMGWVGIMNWDCCCCCCCRACIARGEYIPLLEPNKQHQVLFRSQELTRHSMSRQGSQQQ